jgi:hypothetical protein
MKHVLKISFFLVAGSLLFSSCRKKSDDDDNEVELITTVNLTFTPVAGGSSRIFTFRDIDGEGGAAPTIFQDISLAPNTAYNMSLELLDETKTPPDNITEEVKKEDNEHQFYFVPAGGAAITISNLNADRNGLPLGVTSTWTTGAVSNGTVRIVLKHKPGNKNAGDAITVGDTDIDLAWPARIQ